MRELRRAAAALEVDEAARRPRRRAGRCGGLRGRRRRGHPDLLPHASTSTRGGRPTSPTAGRSSRATWFATTRTPVGGRRPRRARRAARGARPRAGPAVGAPAAPRGPRGPRRPRARHRADGRRRPGRPALALAPVGPAARRRRRDARRGRAPRRPRRRRAVPRRACAARPDPDGPTSDAADARRPGGRVAPPPVRPPARPAAPRPPAGPPRGRTPRSRTRSPRPCPSPVDEVLLQGDLTGIVPGRPTAALAALLDRATRVESRGAALTVRFTAGVGRGARSTPGRPPTSCSPSSPPTRAAACRSRWSTSCGTPRGGTDGCGSGRPAATCAPRTRPCSPGSSTTRRSPSSGSSSSRRPCWPPRSGPPPCSRRCAPAGSRRPPSARTGRSCLAPPARAPGRRPRTASPRRGRRRRARRGAAPPATRPARAERLRSLRPGAAPGRGRAAVRRRPGPGPGTGAGTADPVAALATLREAVADGREVWLEVVDPQGTPQRRRVRPVRVDGGRVRAVDSARDAELTVAVHRIASVTPIDPEDDPFMTDGPLIVQSDKTLLLEVDHDARRGLPPRDRPVRRARARARARPHLPAHAAGPVERARRRATTPSRSSTRCSSTRATPCRTRCWSTSPRRCPGTAACSWSATRRTAWSCTRSTAPCSRRCSARERTAGLVGERLDDTDVVVHPSERGHLKQVLLKLGWPAEDLAGYVDGEAHPIDLLDTDGLVACGPYQQQAVDGFWHGGSGVVVLPCGAGKTLVGAGAMARSGTTTLILVTNTVSARQWRDELVKRTSLTEDEIGEYSGARKEIRPVTIATYQVLTTQAEGRLHAPRAARRPRLGPRRLRRGPPAAGADLPDDGRPAGAPPPRPDRDARARGRPRGRGVLASSGPSGSTRPGRTSRRRATSRRPTASRSA